MRPSLARCARSFSRPAAVVQADFRCLPVVKAIFPNVFGTSRALSGAPKALWRLLGPLGASWAALWARLGASKGPRGPSWGFLGPPEAPFESLLGPCGRLLGAPGEALGASWGDFGRQLGPKKPPKHEKRSATGKVLYFI